MDFVTEYLGTIIIAAALLFVVALIIYKMYKNRRAGKSNLCDCGCCKSCPSADMCHRRDN